MAAQGARLACRIIVVRAPVAKGGGTCIMIRTPDQRVRVFVSSTLEELAAERQAVTAAITQLRLTPVLFELGARPYPPRDLYRAWSKATFSSESTPRPTGGLPPAWKFRAWRTSTGCRRASRG